MAEYDEKLYIILDVERIFGKNALDETARSAFPQGEASASKESRAGDRGEEVNGSTSALQREGQRLAVDDTSREFVKQGLVTFSSFHVTSVNEPWFAQRYQLWERDRTAAGEDVQLTSPADAERFLSSFYSPFTGRIWGEAYARELTSLLPSPSGGIIQVWNPGCSAGHESYSIAATLKRAYPDRQVKVWGSDNDLMKIAGAPNLTFDLREIPEEWHPFMVEGKRGASFSSQITEAILFEFSDLLHATGMPQMDLIVARDFLSLFPLEEQGKLLYTFEEALKPGGVLLLGENEHVLDGAAWGETTGETLTVYHRR